MIDYLKRLRRPGLIAVLVVIGVLVITTVGHFIVLLTRGNGLAGAARLAGASSPSLLWVFAAIVLAFACVLARPRVADSQRLVSAAAGVVAASAGVGLVFWVLSLFGTWTVGTVLGALGGLIEILAKGACGWVLWRMRGINAEEHARLESSTPSTGEPEGQAPVWNPQQATGLQWSRAGDAASGGPAAIAPPTSPQPATQPAPGLPWTTAGQAAEGYPAGAGEDESQPGAQPAGHAPDWTPAKRPPGADV